MTLDPDTIDELVGGDDIPGVLDNYKVQAFSPNGTDKTLIVWRCENGCGQNGNGYVGVIARDMDMSQTNLTLGELVAAALAHGEEEHGGHRRPDLTLARGGPVSPGTVVAIGADSCVIDLFGELAS